MASVTKELNVRFYLILMKLSLNLNSYRWLVVTVLNSTVVYTMLSFPGGSNGKVSAHIAGDPGLIP